MSLSSDNLAVAYEFLRVSAFDRDPHLPSSKFVRFRTANLKNHGDYEYAKGRHIIRLDKSGDTKSWTHALQILAHEMIYLAMRHQDVSDAEAHDTSFKQAAAMVEEKMGWPKGSV